MSYIPGPWEVRKQFAEEYGNPKFCPLAIFGDGWQLVTIIGDVEDIDHEANARLIAAAPELVEALEMFLEPCDEIPYSTFEHARALLARIKGE